MTLDAIHEVEKLLLPAERVDYANNLAKVCGTEIDKIFATAAQKEKALRLTVPGHMELWDRQRELEL